MTPFSAGSADSAPLDERAGPWCGVTKPSEAARWRSGTEEAEACCLALREHDSHRSMCV